MRNRLIIAAKVAVSGSVIFAIARRFEVNQLIPSIHQVHPFYLVIATILALLTVPVVSNRWRLLSGMLSIQISLAIAIRATFASLFVGQLLPGAIGVDVVRGFMVWNMGFANKLVITSLVADRLTSLFAIALMIGATLPILIPYLPNRIAIWVEWSFLSIVVILLFGYFSLRAIWLIKNRFLRHFIDKHFEGMKLSMPVVLVSLSLSVTAHGLTILSAFFLSLGVGIDSSLWMWCLVMPIVILVTAIPISINGWGIREAAMIHLWALFGIAEPEAFLISICLGFVAIVSSLPGFWFWLEKKRKTIDTVHVGDYPSSVKVLG